MSSSLPFAGNTQRRTTECRLHQVPRTVRLLSSVSSSCPSDTSSARRLSAIYLKSQWHVTGESSRKFSFHQTKASKQIPDFCERTFPQRSPFTIYEGFVPRLESVSLFIMQFNCDKSLLLESEHNRRIHLKMPFDTWTRHTQTRIVSLRIAKVE